MMIRNHFLMIRVLQIIISYEGKTEQMIMNNPIEKKNMLRQTQTNFVSILRAP